MEFNFSLLRFGPVLLVMFAVLATAMSQGYPEDNYPYNKSRRLAIEELRSVRIPPPLAIEILLRNGESEGRRLEVKRSGARAEILRSSRVRSSRTKSSGVGTERCEEEPVQILLRNGESEGRRLEVLKLGPRAEILRSSKVRSLGRRSSGVGTRRIRSGKVRAERIRSGKVRAEKRRSGKVRAEGKRSKRVRAGTQ